MTAITARRGVGRGARRFGPVVSLLAALVAAVFVLPSALRPPPDPATTTNALDPHAPPNQNNPSQILESLQSAAGSGAGAGAGAGGATSTTAAPAVTPTTSVRRTSLNYCYGTPPRQIPSVYAGPCVGAWQGNNGGSTSRNVFPNEIRIGLNQVGGPDAGRVPDPSTNDSSTSGNTITYQVLAQYFNTHYQFYNRKVWFYGLTDPSDATADSQAAAAAQYADRDRLFLVDSSFSDACDDFVRAGMVAICNPQTTSRMENYRPGLFSFYMGLDETYGFGAEYVCKTLRGKTAKFGGPEVKTMPRKFGFIGYQGTNDGASAELFASTIKNECGLNVETATEATSDYQGAAATIARFRTDGVTSIIMGTAGPSLVATMQAASKSAYYPEWVELGMYSIDQNFIAGSLLPQDELPFMFGINTGWFQWDQTPASAEECYRAFHSIVPGSNPSSTTCYEYWPQLVLMMDGIQGAGPNLTPATFQQALFNLGHRFGQTCWSIGGGYGPGDYSYGDDVGEEWWDPKANAPDSAGNGAFRWTHDGKRYQRGQLTGDDSELFVSGSSVATC